MSYNFYSLVSSIKDKSSQAMATLSSDLKEFSSIVQEDVAEVANTVRKTVHEQSEALRQRVEQQGSTEDNDDDKEEKEEGVEDGAEGEHKKEKKSQRDDTEEEDTEEQKEEASDSTAPRRASLFSMPSFGGLSGLSGMSLEAVGSKLLHSADEFLGTLTGHGNEQEEEGGEDNEEDEVEGLASARRYRLLALQEDPQTYLHPPMDLETFRKWRQSLVNDEFQFLQDEVLAHYPTVVEKLAEFVPETICGDDFWAHYIYKASLLAAQEQRGADLLEHALNDSEEEVGWDVESPRHEEGEEAEPGFLEDAHAMPLLEDEAGVPRSPTPLLGEDRRRSVYSPAVSDDEDDEDDQDDQEAKRDGQNDSPAAVSSSSDGDSWIELDEQRRDTSALQQPPLSSSSTSSFVPVVVPQDGVETIVGGGEASVKEEEDVDWGNDDDVDETTTNDASEANPEATKEVAGAPPGKKTGGADWGEWD